MDPYLAQDISNFVHSQPADAHNAPAVPNAERQGTNSATTTGETSSTLKHSETELHGLFELTTWHRADHSKYAPSTVDIVAIHGLGGDLYRTWTQSDKLWLRDFLPSLMPEARVLTYGYNSVLAFTDPANSIDDYSRALLERLRAKRRDLAPGTLRPIVFVCHNVGGLILKQALLIAEEKKERYSSILLDTTGMIFLGTPHHGADPSFWERCLHNLAVVSGLRADQHKVTDGAKHKALCLGDICTRFEQAFRHLAVFSVYERLKIRGQKQLVVEKESSVLKTENEVPIPLEADHNQLCRFAQANDQNLQTIIDCLRDLVQSPDVASQPDCSTLHEDFLRCLGVEDPETSLRKMIRPSPGTCDWITQTTEYRTWRGSASPKILWLHGSPGSGKTVVLRYVVEALRKSLQREESGRGPRSVVLFCFPDGNQWQLRQPEEVLKSLLYQSLTQVEDCFQCVKAEDLELYAYGQPTDSQNLLKTILLTILQRTKNIKFWIVLDAFDEFVERSRFFLLSFLLQTVEGDVAHKLKFLISDRARYPARLSNVEITALGVQGRTEAADDVRLFLSAAVSDLCSDGQIPWKFQTQIEDALIGASESNFLQARLAWTNFSTGVSRWSEHIIRRRLDALREITREADAYYCSLLTRIPEDSRDVARSGFVWVLGSRKPLGVSELKHAVAISAGQQSWSELVEALGFNFELQFDQAFGYLLQIDAERRVRFAHQSIRGLLTSPVPTDHANREVLTRYHVDPQDIDAEIAKACMVVLSFRDFVSLRDIAQEAISDEVQSALIKLRHPNLDLARFDFSKYDDLEDQATPVDQMPVRELKRTLSNVSLGASGHTLLSYCVAYWNYHCIEGGANKDVVQSLSDFVLLRQSHFFHLIAMLLGAATVHHGPFWSTVNQFARTPPLQFLMRIGDHPGALEKLLANGHSINDMDCHGWSALTWAALEGRTNSLNLLLAREDLLISARTLQACCRGDSSTQILMRLLEDSRVDINAMGASLHHLMESGTKPEIVDILLSRPDLDVNATDKAGYTYIDLAFQPNSSESSALKLISRHDVPINWFQKTLKRPRYTVSEERSPTSFIERASVLRWIRVEQAILQVDPLQALKGQSDGQSLLEHYARHGLEHRLNHVLDALPEDIFEKNPNYPADKLLNLCAQQDWPQLVLRLKSVFKIPDHLRGAGGRTLIHWASELGWQCITVILANKSGLWIDLVDSDGRTALHIAAENRNELACRALLEAGADHRVRDRHHRLPAHIAAVEGHRSVLLCLLEHPIKHTDKDIDNRQMLHYLVMWSAPIFLRRCLKVIKPKVDVFDKRRRTPLHYAAIYGNSGAIQVLLEAGAKPGLRDSSGFTALQYALTDASIYGVQQLLEHKADIHNLDRYGRNSLHLAVRSEDISILNFILKQYSSNQDQLKEAVKQPDQFGRTVLHGIAAWGSRSNQAPEEELDEEEAFLIELDLDDLVLTRRAAPNFAAVKRYSTLFVSLGASPNATDIYGRTPLHVAVESNNMTAVEVLLGMSDVQLSLEDDKGCTTLDRAVTDGYEGIAELLRSYGVQHTEEWKDKIKPLYSPWQEEEAEGGESKQEISELALVTV